jgi:hypothetical protein
MKSSQSRQSVAPRRASARGGEGWQDLVASMLAKADIILMLPHDSPGVRWEVEQIVAAHVLSKVVFIMPPAASGGLDARELWKGAASMMRDYSFEIPPFQDDGLFFRLGESGRTVESFAFDVIWDNTLFQRLESLLPRADA